MWCQNAVLISLFVAWFHCVARSAFTFTRLPPENHAVLMERFLKLRYSNRQRTTWYYTGSVSDPANGMKVAGIEGIEHVEPLSNGLPTSNFSVSLKESNILRPAYVVRKVFIYTNENDRSEAKLKFRKSKIAPQRQVNPVNEFVHIIAFGDRSRNSTRTYLFWPSKRHCQGSLRPMALDMVTVGNTQSPNSVTLQHRIFARPPLKINKWIGFGGGRDGGAKSVEVYNISPSPFATLLPLVKFFKLIRGSSINYRHSPVVLHYRRYGESPSWLAPGRPCEMVIHGFQVKSVEDIPRSTQKLFQEHAPHMLVDDDDPTLEDFVSSKDRAEMYKPWYSALWEK